ncbi:unnamed protein product [Calicophoron daubneyi]|uniref:FERM domain-containing protein n=1 Tax=Calicophoron daubneyi TaxID=300641 RepID=A0AAV2SYY8_CALDB
MSCIADDKCFAVQVKVTLLDDSVHCFGLSNTTKTIRILNKVAEILKLTHTYYFGLKVLDKNHRWQWLSLQKQIQAQLKLFECSPVIEQSSSQILNHFDTTAPDAPNQSVHPTDSQAGGPRRRLSLQLCGFASCHSGCTPAESPPRGSGMERQKPLTLTYHAYLGVRFYPLDPTCITNEQTRYQIFLQVRADLISGRMQIEKELFITLCGLILQSDCGDYGEDRLGSSYVRRLLKMPEMDREMENRIKAKHVECRCRQPALVEYQLLDKVKHCISYGQTKFAVKCTQGEGTVTGVMINRVDEDNAQWGMYTSHPANPNMRDGIGN